MLDYCRSTCNVATKVVVVNSIAVEALKIDSLTCTIKPTACVSSVARAGVTPISVVASCLGMTAISASSALIQICRSQGNIHTERDQNSRLHVIKEEEILKILICVNGSILQCVIVNILGCDFMQLGNDHILTVAISGTSETWC